MDAILKSLLEQVSDLHDIPVGAYNIRNNGQSESRNCGLSCLFSGYPCCW